MTGSFWGDFFVYAREPQPRAAAYKAGKGAGNNLNGAGMNVNLAPALDVSRNNGGFLDKFQRTYSSDPFEVATLGSAFITAQQKTGVAATSKHFPGLGAAKDDTDGAPVTLPLSKHTLRTVDEVPYHSAIAAGTELVMLSNATYPALDPNRPAGPSPVVIQKELRVYLGFRGVTITDALEAGGLEEFGSVPERGVLAADAGADLLLFAAQDISSGVEGLRASTRRCETDASIDRSTRSRRNACWRSEATLQRGTSGGSRTGKPGSCLAVAPPPGGLSEVELPDRRPNERHLKRLIASGTSRASTRCQEGQRARVSTLHYEISCRAQSVSRKGFRLQVSAF